MNVFVRKDDIWVSVFVSWCLEIVYFQILIFFIFVKSEIKIALCSNFSVSITFKSSKFFLTKLILESHFFNLSFNEFSNLRFHF